jgi:hypothetical protein
MERFDSRWDFPRDPAPKSLAHRGLQCRMHQKNRRHLCVYHFLLKKKKNRHLQSRQNALGIDFKASLKKQREKTVFSKGTRT